MASLSVLVEFRSTPPLLWWLVQRTDDVVERRRIAGLGTWEIRMDGGAWMPLQLWDLS